MTAKKISAKSWPVVLGLLFVLWLSATLTAEKSQLKPLKPGEESRGPWWMKQTALTPKGQMPSLKNKSWWKKAAELKVGEQLLLKEGKAEQENMLVKISEISDANGQKLEVLMWIIDDDEDGSVVKGGDFHDDCYVYDFYRDGKVEVMVDYADENKDGQADFMEVRFFDRGQLAKCWSAFDYDGLGEMIKCHEPSDLLAAGLELNLSGNKAYYFHRYDPLRLGWVPETIYPLASLDLDGDGLSEKLIRVNLQTRPEPKSLVNEDAATAAPMLIWPEVGSLEFSLDLDRGNSAENPYHYDLGLIISGEMKYDLEEYKNFSPLRRPPQEIPAIPPAEVDKKIKEFKVQDVFFSWKENHLPISDRVLSLTVKEEQGLGWSWERFKAPTSSPDVEKWNVRREVAEKLGHWPEFYYSELDRKIHLFRAKSGWWPIGYVAGLPKVGEIRYFDTDDDGYFDREEIYLANSVRPVLVVEGHNRQVKKLPFDFDALSKFYTEEVVPAGRQRFERLIQAMTEVLPFSTPEEFRVTLQSSTGSDKQYLLEVGCLLQFISLRDHYFSLVNQKLFQSGEASLSGRLYGDLYPALVRKPGSITQGLSSEQAWVLAQWLSQLDAAYTGGDDEKFISILKEIKKLRI